MIPYSYNMVDMGGIDLAEANRTVVEGLYNRLAMARNACGDLILYNWKFAEIEITPGICSTLDEGTSIVINGLIEVTEQDEVIVLGIDPPPVPVEPLIVNSDGVYEAEPPLSGFNPVTVNVSNTMYVYNCGLIEGHIPINIFNGEQSADVSYNADGTAHVLGAAYNRRFFGFALDLTEVQSVDFICSFAATDGTIGVIASQTIEDIMNNRQGSISIYPAYTSNPPANRVCKMVLDTSALSGQYYVGILGYEERWASDLAIMRINRSVH